MNPSPSREPSRWQLLGRTQLLHTRIFDVSGTRYRHPVRQLERDFVAIDSADWVNVIALTPDQQIVLVRQFRFGIDALSWEIPGGIIEHGESPLVAGPRELQEETGYTGQAASLLGSVHPNPAIQNNRCHLVLVEGAQLTHPEAWDDDEELETKTVPAEQVFAMARNGEITHSMVVNAVLLFEAVWRARARV